MALMMVSTLQSLRSPKSRRRILVIHGITYDKPIPPWHHAWLHRRTACLLTEGLVRSVAADAAGDANNALYDKTPSRSSGAGLLFNQTVRRMNNRMSHAVVRGSSEAVLRLFCH